jgi:hypothetical protein
MLPAIDFYAFISIIPMHTIQKISRIPYPTTAASATQETQQRCQKKKNATLAKEAKTPMVC